MTRAKGFRGEHGNGPRKDLYINNKVRKEPTPQTGESRPHGLFLDDGDVQLWHGDALTVLRDLPPESVHMCVTSPPFYGLRDYGTGRWEGGDPDCDHSVGGQVQQTKAGTDPNAVGMRPGVDASRCRKCGARRVDQQIGLEETPEQWVDSLVAVFREVRRVLRPEGTLWVEIGDSYNAHPGGAGDRGGRSMNALQGDGDGQPQYVKGYGLGRVKGLKPKDLIGAPWMLAFALRADGWYLRSDIVWARPNPMPESVTDRPTKSHSYVFLLAKQPRYFFDQEAVREPHQYDGRNKLVHDHAVNGSHENYAHMGTAQERWPNSGRNVRSVWNTPEPLVRLRDDLSEDDRSYVLAELTKRGL